MDLAKNLNMAEFGRGDATLKDASHKHMDMSGKDEILVQEEHGLSHKIKVLVSKDLGQDELVASLEDLKDIGILHKEFPKTLPERCREDAKQVNCQYNSIKGDPLNEQIEIKEKREMRREKERGESCCILRRDTSRSTRRSQTLTHSLKTSRWS